MHRFVPTHTQSRSSPSSNNVTLRSTHQNCLVGAQKNSWGGVQCLKECQWVAKSKRACFKTQFWQTKTKQSSETLKRFLTKKMTTFSIQLATCFQRPIRTNLSLKSNWELIRTNTETSRQVSRKVCDNQHKTKMMLKTRQELTGMK